MNSAKQFIVEVVDSRIEKATEGITNLVAQVQTVQASTSASSTPEHQQLLKRSTEKTFAECLHKNAPIGKFSVIAPDDMENLINLIEEDDDLVNCGQCNIIERRTPTSLAVSSDEATVVCIKEKIRDKYPLAEIRMPDATPKFMVKITGSPAKPIEGDPTESQLAEASTKFKLQNKIPPEKMFEVRRMWTLKGSKATYTNYVVEVDKEYHKIIQGRITEGFAQRIVVEHIDILQCKKCWRYVHLKRTCTFPTACKICGADHEAENCTEDVTKPVCTNCTRHNATAETKIGTNHFVASDTCLIRINRVERLKIHFSAPEKRMITF